MGSQQKSWSKKFSPGKLHQANKYKSNQTTDLARRPQYIKMRPMSADYSIANEMYEVVCDCDFVGERCRRLVDRLFSRLRQGKDTIRIGKIINFKASISYVKPINYNGDLSVGNRFGIHLQPWYFEGRVNYLVMLRNERGYPSIFLTRKGDSLYGAANFLFTGEQQVKYPPFLYDCKTIEALFKLECVLPFMPSPNYRRV